VDGSVEWPADELDEAAEVVEAATRVDVDPSINDDA
jgi:hypothetical protein